MKKKIQIELSDHAMEELEWLKANTDATSYAQVLRTALRIYGWCLRHKQQNRHVYAKESDGRTVFELLLP